MIPVPSYGSRFEQVTSIKKPEPDSLKRKRENSHSHFKRGPCIEEPESRTSRVAEFLKRDYLTESQSHAIREDEVRYKPRSYPSHDKRADLEEKTEKAAATSGVISRVSALPPAVLTSMISRVVSIEELERVYKKHGHSFNNIHLVTTINRLAKIKGAKPYRGFKPLVEDLVGRISSQVSRLDARSLANAAWACAKLEIKNEALVAAIAREVQGKIRDFDPQPLANTAWAYATLGVYNEALMSAIAGEAQAVIRKFSPQGLANTAWAYGTLGVYNKALMSAIAGEAQAVIRKFSPQGLANTAWAYAKLGVYNEPLMSAIASEAQAVIRKFSPQELANTAWSYAKLGICDKTFMGELADAVCEKVNDFDSQSLANTLLAYAKLGIHDFRLMIYLAEPILSRITEFTIQALANIAWSMAVLDFRDLEVLGSLKRVIWERSLTNSFNSKECSQLIQCSDWLRIAGIDSSFLPPEISDCVRLKRVVASLFENSVHEVLSVYSPDFICQPEVELRDIHHYSDFRVYSRHTMKECIIEVDGPGHYSRTGSPLGHTILRNNLLKAAGYNLVSIPYYEWDDLRNFDECVVYLKKLLEPHLL